MNNLMNIDGCNAIIRYDAEINLFRGEFLGLNGSADFYADSIEALRTEGAKSLKVFKDMCREDGVEYTKPYSGKFQVRLPSELHARLAETAAARGHSLNQLVQRAIEHEIQE